MKKKGCRFQNVFRRLLPRLGYKAAIWAIAHRLGRLVWKILHNEITYVERGTETNPKANKHRALKLAPALRKLGYQVALISLTRKALQRREGDFQRSVSVP